MSHRVLILTDDTTDADNIATALGNATKSTFVAERHRCLSPALERLQSNDIDAVIVDLSLPDSEGVATFDQLFAAAPHTPILILTPQSDDRLAMESIQRGAQGCLVKEHLHVDVITQTLRNVIQRKAVEEELFREKARAEISLNSISDAVLCTDVEGRINYLNVAGEKLTGWSREEALGHPASDVLSIVNAVSRQPQRSPVELVLRSDEAMGLDANTILVRRDGSEIAIEDSASPIHDWNGHLAGVIIVFHDVTDSRMMAAKMAHMAQHDFLTGLPNRLLLSDRIAQAIKFATRHRTRLAVMFLDLDKFKEVNDSYGHAIGDALLRSVTQRLTNCVRQSDTVSRQGGDEFVILLTEVKLDSDITLAAEKILKALARPHYLPQRELFITCSMGISIFPADGDDAEALIKAADTAMYAAKGKGRDNFQFFDSETNAVVNERRIVESDLQDALEKQQFVLHYQPKVNLKSGAITGVEALLRWNHDEWGIVSPLHFVSIAEDCGLIVPIGRWVLREACFQAKRWMDAGFPTISMAVNVSSLEFRQKNFLESTMAILKETRLAPECLQLEITESVLMENAESSTTMLRELSAIGVQLAVDDFGTGYSSLSYLTRFPINVLKIDQSFVNEIESLEHNGIIASAVIGMGNNLKLKVIAEGVENSIQLAFLKARDCEEGQGFLFSRPLIAAEFGSLLSADIPEMRAAH